MTGTHQLDGGPTRKRRGRRGVDEAIFGNSQFTMTKINSSFHYDSATTTTTRLDYWHGVGDQKSVFCLDFGRIYGLLVLVLSCFVLYTTPVLSSPFLFFPQMFWRFNGDVFCSD